MLQGVNNMQISFSAKVKKELCSVVPKARHCKIAEACALTAFGPDKRNSFTSVDKNIIIDEGVSLEVPERIDINTYVVSPLVLQQTCCKRSFIRGAFISAGSVNDMSKSYHLEIVCITNEQAEQLCEAIASFGLNPKIMFRNEHFVVYLKEAQQIVDLLAVMEAPKALMEAENQRILNEMRGQINRQVNCETANLAKTTSTAYRQVEDIRLIEKVRGLDSLPTPLYEAAMVRLQYQEMPLANLGKMMEPPIGKSGINHRLNKISAIADEIRETMP